MDISKYNKIRQYISTLVLIIFYISTWVKFYTNIIPTYILIILSAIGFFLSDINFISWKKHELKFILLNILILFLSSTIFLVVANLKEPKYFLYDRFVIRFITTYFCATPNLIFNNFYKCEK